jgi:hypothetical protein
MNLRPALLPPALDPDQVARLTELADQVIAAIDAGRPAKELIARFNADAATRLTQFDFHTAASARGMRDYVERVLTLVPARADLDDAEATELVRRVKTAEGTVRERDFWVRLLAKGLQQPGMSDLLFHPNQQLAPAEIVQIARTCSGTALAGYLAPSRRGYHVARALLRRLADRRLLALQKGASLDDLARGAEQFLTDEKPGPRQLTALAAWLVEQPTVEELFADDDQLGKHLAHV